MKKTSTRLFEPSTQVIAESPEEIYDYWFKTVAKEPWFDPSKEHLVTFLMSHHKKVTGYNLVSIGTNNQTFAKPVDVLRPAVIENIHSIIVAHNHPSGDCTPSAADIRATRLINSAAETLEIGLCDHIVIGQETIVFPEGFYSFRNQGLL